MTGARDWVDDAAVPPEREGVSNMVEAFVRFMQQAECCDDCIAKVRAVRDGLPIERTP